MSLFDKLVEWSGGAEKVTRNSNAGRAIAAQGVTKSAEWTRIASLPRRRWQDNPDLEQVRKDLTRFYKKPNGTQELTNVQAATIWETCDCRGAIGLIRVGGGKTHISLLLPTVFEARRPLLVVPADLKDKTHRNLVAFKKHWKHHPNLKIISYYFLSQEKNAKFLWDYQPDLIIFDEGHRARNITAGRVKRLRRYHRDFPECAWLIMSGTLTDRSVNDYPHLFDFALGEMAPTPLIFKVAKEWGDALDSKVKDGHRRAPGAILELDLNVQGKTLLQKARRAYRKRLVETPGVIATDDKGPGMSLVIHESGLRCPPKIKEMIARLHDTWETPGGDWLTEPIEVWRCARQLAMGCYYRWDPPAPKGWLYARKEWKKYVRETLKHNRRDLDTELQVWKECREKHAESCWKCHRAGECLVDGFLHKCTVCEGSGFKNVSINPNHCEWCAWEFNKHTFKPNTVYEWVDDFVMRAAAEWLQKDHTQGIVWTEHPPLGEKLAVLSCFPYFGAGAPEIEQYEGACIASVAAHSEGKNLQHVHSRNLVLCPSGSGKRSEQMIGRTHREFQPEDEVSVTYNRHTAELDDALRSAVEDARFLEDTQGQPQKLNIATWSFEL